MTKDTQAGTRPAPAPTKENAPAGTRAGNTSEAGNHTASDPLAGWYSLAANVKPSRTDRHQKRGWQRGRK